MSATTSAHPEPDVQGVLVPRGWVRRLLRTGESTDLTPGQYAELRSKLRDLGEEAKRRVVEQLQYRVATLKANAADNVNKTTSTQDVAKQIILAVATVLATVLVSNNRALTAAIAGLAVLAVLPLGAAIIIPVIAFKPKSKNWRPPDLRSTALDILRAATDEAGDLDKWIIDLAEMEHHWKQLLRFERRVLNVVSNITATGTVLVVATAAIAAIGIVVVNVL